MPCQRAVGRVVADQQGAVGREDAHAAERPRAARLHASRARRGGRGSGSPPARGTRRRPCRGESARGRGGRLEAPARRGGSPSRRRPGARARRRRRQAARGGPRGRARSRRRPGGTRARDASGCPGARRARPGAASSAGGVRPPHREGPVVPRHAVAGDRARDEPHGGPREPPSPEVAHDEAQPRRARPAGGGASTTASSGRWWRTSEQSATSTEPGRMGASSASPATTLHLGGAVRGPRGVAAGSPGGRRGPRSAPGGRGAAPIARAPAGCPPPPVPDVEDAEGLAGREPREERRDVPQDGLRGADPVQPGDVGEAPGQLGGRRVRAGPSARCARPRGAAGPARAARTGASRPRRRSRARAPS